MSYGDFDEAMGENHRAAISYREKLAQYEEPDYDRDRAGSFLGGDDRANRPDVVGDQEPASRMPLRNLGRSRSDSSADLTAPAREAVLTPQIAQSLKPSPTAGPVDIDLGRALMSKRRFDDMAPLFMGGNTEVANEREDDDLSRQWAKDAYLTNATTAMSAGISAGDELEQRRAAARQPQRRGGFWGSWFGRGLSRIGRGIKGLFGRGRRRS